MIRPYDAIVIGAGPAGSSAAITLAQGGFKVGLIDRFRFPRQKICGGFIGGETRPILEQLGVYDAVAAVAAPLARLDLVAGDGPGVSLPLRSGWGISRYVFDQLLLNRARQVGVVVLDGSADDVLKTARARHVILATGASKTARRLYIGAGATFRDGRDGSDHVSLHFVRGGHLGVNRFQGGLVNACYVVAPWLFERLHKDMRRVFEHFLVAFPLLKEQFSSAATVSHFKGISICRPAHPCFTSHGRLHAGDAVDVVNPVVGSGNSLALASGVLLARTLLRHHTAPFGRLHVIYRRAWRDHFGGCIAASWCLGHLSHQPILTKSVIRLFRRHETWFQRIFDHAHQPLELKIP